jgi:D-glycero-D-manno-heptose 1,7-bisphosphate phosphatase
MTLSERPIVVLDRDGVINHDSDHYIKSLDEFVPIAGSLEAMGRLSHEGWRIFVATNQSGLARGLFDLQTLHAMHSKLQDLLEEMGGTIEAVFFCPHGPETGCLCRKPAPGLLHDIAHRVGGQLTNVPVIGDSHRDLAAAISVGARPILVKTGKGEKTLRAHQSGEKPLPSHAAGIPVFADLSHAAMGLLDNAPPLLTV